jgi:Phage tail lysozyme
MAGLDPQYVISGLVARGVPLHVAQGVTARLNGESGLNPGINEIAPLVEGSRGGFGLAQWTGPRRRQLESFAAERGLPVNDPELQLDFLMWENANTEKGAWSKVMGAKDAVHAAELFTNHWERPGIPHLDATLATARKYSGIEAGPYTPQAPNGLATPDSEAPQNALAQQPQAPQMNFAQMDPAMFMRQPGNALAMMQPLQYARRGSLG